MCELVVTGTGGVDAIGGAQARTSWHESNGWRFDGVLFHGGVWASIVQNDGSVVAFETRGKARESTGSLVDWYLALREEYASRYGLS
jgi:hypothetical protein